MRFTWIEGACILGIAIAALTTQSGDRSERLSAAQAFAAKERTSLVADLRPASHSKGNVNERATSGGGR